MPRKILACLVLLIISHLGLNVLANPGQPQKKIYQTAFLEMSQMLSGGKEICFKKAVFLMENAFSNGSLSYEEYNSKIGGIAVKLREMIVNRHLERFRTAGNWAAFTYMTDTIAENNFSPYSYDFNNFLPDKDPAVGFVTKLLRTHKGNCNSLPFLYKILTQEIGVASYLALAPIHCYIKHKDEKGNWVNLEMTSGSFARDEWIMQETGVTVDQIKSGIYMNALSEKESIALVMKELAANYQFQFGADNFDLAVCETALKYYPNSITLLMVKYEHYRTRLLQARKNKDVAIEDRSAKILADIDKQFKVLGYVSTSKSDYKDWVRENQKSRQNHDSLDQKNF